MRLIHFTDTHLSPEKIHFQENWDIFSKWLNSIQADYLLHTGDLSLDGADSAFDLTYAHQAMNEISVPVYYVPGNHDIGHTLHPTQSITDERLARWRNTVGPDYWCLTLDKWVFIGINSLLCGSNHPDEEKQLSWLRQTIEESKGKFLAIFTHKPFFMETPDESERGYWTIPPLPRQQLLEILMKGDVRLVSSGHLHVGRIFIHNEITYCWSPSSAFVVADNDNELLGRHDLGASLITLNEETGEVDAELIFLGDLKRLVLDDFIEEVYPTSP